MQKDVPFIKYTANYLTIYSQMICSVLNKWHFHFYLSAHNRFGFFSFVGYLPSKLHIKNIKTPFFDLDVNDLYHILTKLCQVLTCHDLYFLITNIFAQFLNMRTIDWYMFFIPDTFIPSKNLPSQIVKCRLKYFYNIAKSWKQQAWKTFSLQARAKGTMCYASDMLVLCKC